ncbi:MAG TPA: long-chain fatty acid--CoA ligase [Leptospiraceae bacterium]|nr:long-chain fatty acid--CoA ligase [Leptospiraceae bacterium]HNF16548.1 long-chain fatty acid--CoA ligase [Leptospiraceae bacterium]HNF23887.1 long-chain fatty acid--CoA ligase [Leptospiraceae bacterium]HNH07854.1 long-chain fatty acid--CoA ligase [Leptospiraceae bacterium]HNI97551.1 long-chain fatty acid--CoA ligase [Leptospiraceae bacterium]
MYSNLAEMFVISSEKYSDFPAFASRDASGKFHSIKYGELKENAECLSAALLDLGAEPGDRIGIFSDNRLEWILADMAVIMAGCADVPRGSDVTDGDIKYIISHSEAEILFVENEEVLKKIRRNSADLPHLRTLIMMDRNSKATDSILHIYDLMEKGKRILSKNPSCVRDRIRSISGDDLFTLIYTSGTTGTPKGVMLTHRNMVSQLKNNPIEIHSSDRILSILPVWHIFERVFEMTALSKGCCTYYTNVRNFREDLKTVRPTFMASAPRLWESVYQGIMSNLERASIIRKKMFSTAYYLASAVRSAQRFLSGQAPDLEGRTLMLSVLRGAESIITAALLYIPFRIMDSLVLSKIREATGGQLRGSCSGGGALPLHVDEFFCNVGIPVLEGYGMTETSPVISVRTFQNLVPGTVGPLYKGTEIRLLDIHTGEQIYPGKNGFGRKGEIHVRGEQVMKGYFKNQEATEKVLKDGWLNTGDLGMMTYNGCLKITGRSKETIVLLGGENVEPVPLENRLLESPLIDQCMVAGQDRKFLSALIVPRMERFREYGSSLSELSENESVRKILREELKRLVSTENGFKSFEKISDFRILPKSFEAGDELSAKLSIKRHIITEKYSHLIDDMYKKA